MINSIDSIDFEGDITVDPMITLKEPVKLPSDRDFIFIPTAQLKGNMIVLALEPKSMLGLATYEKYSHLIISGKPFPVFRVIESKK